MPIDIEREFLIAARRDGGPRGKLSIRNRLRGAKSVARHYASLTELLAEANGTLQVEVRARELQAQNLERRTRMFEIALAVILLAALVARYV